MRQPLERLGGLLPATIAVALPTVWIPGAVDSFILPRASIVVAGACVGLGVALHQDADRALLAHRLLRRRDRALAADRDRQHHAGEQHGVANGNDDECVRRQRRQMHRTTRRKRPGGWRALGRRIESAFG